MENILTREEEKEIDKMFKSLEAPLEVPPLESVPNKGAEEVIELTKVVEEPPIKSREEILKERSDLVDEWKKLQGRKDYESKKMIEELEIRARQTEEELELLEIKSESVEIESETNLKPKKGNNRKQKKFTIISSIILAIIVILWGVWTVWISEKLKQTEKALLNARTETANLKKTQVVPVPTEPFVPLPEILKIATVQKGEGIEHSLARQLQEDPFTYGFGGDATPKTVKIWAQKKAHQIAILAGYVNQKTGEEVRIKGNGGNIAYVLSIDGDRISIEQYSADQTGNFNPDPVKISPDRQVYEYIYKV